MSLSLLVELVTCVGDKYNRHHAIYSTFNLRWTTDISRLNICRRSFKINNYFFFSIFRLVNELRESAVNKMFKIFIQLDSNVLHLVLFGRILNFRQLTKVFFIHAAPIAIMSGKDLWKYAMILSFS